MNAVAQTPPSQHQMERTETLSRLREVVAALEDGDDELFDQKFAQLLRAREDGLFVNLARITRRLHSAVVEMKFDSRLAQFANAEMPDACLRLDYVVQVTEAAAHKTLDLVEKSRELAGRVAESGQQLAAARARAGFAAPSPVDMMVLNADLGVVQDTISGCAGKLREHLSELAQTQEYQDLTGQVIKRVTSLVRDVESALIELLRASGAAPAAAAGAAIGLQGPAVPGVNSAASQQDADSLLASLGF
jgi:chemotaxis protein CheZ